MSLKYAFTEFILKNALGYEWTLQGFGMLRLHLSDKYRLNIWDSRFRTPNVSLIHSHPWHFESEVIAGVLRNTIYEECPVTRSSFTATHQKGVIIPGPGGGLHNILADVMLVPRPTETYKCGDRYLQEATEIHLSDPDDGTITFNDRTRVGDDKAFVYWPVGGKWVSAEPRGATLAEVEAITSLALSKWF